MTGAPGSPVRGPRREEVAAPPTVLAVHNVSKRFGAVQALSDVSVDCRAGEVHAVLGENGSGKSTLLGIMSGVLEPDTGEVRIGRHRVESGHVDRVRDLGLAMAYQTYSLVRDLTIAQNLFLSAPPSVRPPHGETSAWARSQLERFGIDLEPRARVAGLRLAQRQFLEVAKALVGDPSVLLLDEPTTALGPGDVERLHALVLSEVQRGVGVLYVSHRLPEVLGIADRVTVLRDGLLVETTDAVGTDEDRLVSLMIGRPVQQAFPDTAGGEGAGVAVEIDHLTGDQFGPVSLSISKGEIIGLAGAEGNGQDGFMRSVGGISQERGGRVRVDGRDARTTSPASAMKQGVMFLSGERLRESLFPVLGVRTNTTVQILRRVSRLGFIRSRYEARLATGAVTDLKIRTPSIEQPIRFLSGGNQQKVVLARPFLRDVRLLLMQEPTQGVDVRSRFEIYDALRLRAQQGTAMLIQSSDPIELAGVCDRVLVMSRGKITDEISGEELTEGRIVDAIVRAKGPHEGSPASDTDAASAEGPPPDKPGSWRAMATLVLLMLLVGGYAASQSSAFLSPYNLGSLLQLTVPLALVSMGQLHALLLAEFDVSVGALMGFGVVVGSFWLARPTFGAVLLGAAALLLMSLVVGLVNATLVRALAIPSIIATIATLSVLQGSALILRPTPGGAMNSDFMRYATASVGFVPYAFIGVVVLALGLDLWLYRSRDGLETRAVGFDRTSAGRVGLKVGRRYVRAFLLSSLFAGVGALFLAALVGVGDARLGGTFTLPSIAAAVIGGAALSGGRGSFLGAVNGALFFTLILNVLPFLGWSSSWGDVSRGAITLLALLLFERRGLGAMTAGLRSRLMARIESDRSSASVQ
ncbi:MAG: ATP-binding cassette domain-containing protein [Actinobacteria bacterium]|nr:ATP-binding cassette domain-containing protein [Actinomycetota bacterium]